MLHLDVSFESRMHCLLRNKGVLRRKCVLMCFHCQSSIQAVFSIELKLKWIKMDQAFAAPLAGATKLSAACKATQSATPAAHRSRVERDRSLRISSKLATRSTRTLKDLLALSSEHFGEE